MSNRLSTWWCTKNTVDLWYWISLTFEYLYLFFLGLMNYLSVLWKVLLPIGLHINECPAFCTKQKMFLENLRLNVSDVSENVHNIFTFEEYLNWNWPIFSAKNVLMNVVLLPKIVRIVLALSSTQNLAVLVTHTQK